MDLEASTVQFLGNIGRNRGRHQDLLGATHPLRQAATPFRVQLREHVVQYQHGIVAIGTKQLERGEFERQRERPGFPLARVPPRRKLAQPQTEFVAVWSHEADPALQFALTGLGHGRTQDVHKLWTVRRELARVRDCRTAVVKFRGPPEVGQPGVGLTDTGT